MFRTGVLSSEAASGRGMVTAQAPSSSNRPVRPPRRLGGVILLSAAVVLLAASAGFGQNFRETRQLANNNIIALAGSGDTLWLATEKGLNYHTSIGALVGTQEGWRGFDSNGPLYPFGLAFGDGAAAALVFTNEFGFWHFDHATGGQWLTNFRIRDDENWDLANPTGSMIYTHGSFWAALGHGGLVRYNPDNNSVLATRPDLDREIPPQNFPRAGSTDSSMAVKELRVSEDGSRILVTTLRSTYWAYDPDSMVWAAMDSLPPDPIYAAIDSADLRPLLAAAGDVANPEVNDILFLPRGDGTGTLVVATTTGLYICESANPLEGEYGGFVLIRHVREIKRGDAYALPGIIRGDADSRYNRAVFVYRLKKDGDVTIRIYDYRMSLVKTVVRGERRSSKTERSNNPSRDFWDGTNQAGRPAAVGVYYFKITSTGGDRYFGKVILAK